MCTYSPRFQKESVTALCLNGIKPSNGPLPGFPLVVKQE